MSSLAAVMSPSYLNHFLDVLQLLSHHPSNTAVSTLRFLINNMNNWNSIGDDDSSVDRICIEGVTGETISHLVASALNAMATLQRFPLEHWATPFYNAVALESQEELVVDDEQDSLQNSALTVSVRSTSITTASTRSSSSTTPSSTNSLSSSLASTTAASTIAVSLENESPGDEEP